MAEVKVITYLLGVTNYPVNEEAVKVILAQRGIDLEATLADTPVKDQELAKADLLVWLCTSPSKVGVTRDSDNGWSHSEGGYTLYASDRAWLLRMANAIYSKYSEQTLMSTSHFKVRNHGIRHCNYGLGGRPLPMIEK